MAHNYITIARRHDHPAWELVYTPDDPKSKHTDLWNSIKGRTTHRAFREVLLSKPDGLSRRLLNRIPGADVDSSSSESSSSSSSSSSTAALESSSSSSTEALDSSSSSSSVNSSSSSSSTESSSSSS